MLAMSAKVGREGSNESEEIYGEKHEISFRNFKDDGNLSAEQWTQM